MLRDIFEMIIEFFEGRIGGVAVKVSLRVLIEHDEKRKIVTSIYAPRFYGSN